MTQLRIQECDVFMLHDAEVELEPQYLHHLQHRRCQSDNGLYGWKDKKVTKRTKKTFTTTLEMKEIREKMMTGRIREMILEMVVYTTQDVRGE